MMIEFNKINIDTMQDIENYLEERVKHGFQIKYLLIEKGYTEKELKIINSFLKKNNDCIVSLSVDYSNKNDENKIWFLDILEHLNNIHNLKIIVSGTEGLISITAVSSLATLKSFCLKKKYKKTISLKPLEKFKELEKLELGWGLNNSQQQIINKFENLTVLNIRSIDLKDFDIKRNVEKLRIGYSVKEHQKINELFPNLKFLSMNQCKEVNDFSFINNFSNLEELSLNYMAQLKEFPRLENQKMLKKLEIFEARNLTIIDNVMNFKTLEKLAITRIKGLRASDFERFSELKKLNTLYADFENNFESEEFEKLALKNGWTNSLLTW